MKTKRKMLHSSIQYYTRTLCIFSIIATVQKVTTTRNVASVTEKMTFNCI